MNKFTIKKASVPLIWLVAIGLAFWFGYSLGQDEIPSIEKVEGLDNKETFKPDGVDFGLFWDAWHLIEEKYIERNDLNRQEMVYGAISGLLKSLDDPYSVFMEPVDSKRFLDDISGSFEGIGAEIGIRKRFLTIISPLEGNPAQRAGLKAGDKVLKIDNTLTADLTLDEAVNLIRGEKGTEVSLLISREDWDQAQEIKVIRDTIQIPVIKWEFKDNKIAHINLYHFTENSNIEFAKIIRNIISENAQGIVLDLRNNPGGYLEIAVDIASWFVPKGELVVTESFGDETNSEKDNEFKSRGHKALEEMPTVILINQGSASASEIVAGALQGRQNVKVVGQKSFGKGSVQQLQTLKDNSSIKITIAKWLTPSGVSINEEGIMPDFEVEFTSEDTDEMRDPQLNKALELLNE